MTCAGITEHTPLSATNIRVGLVIYHPTRPEWGDSTVGHDGVGWTHNKPRVGLSLGWGRLHPSEFKTWYVRPGQ